MSVPGTQRLPDPMPVVPTVVTGVYPGPHTFRLLFSYCIRQMGADSSGKVGVGAIAWGIHGGGPTRVFHSHMGPAANDWTAASRTVMPWSHQTADQRSGRQVPC